MSTRLLFSALLLLALGLGAWWAREMPDVQRWLPMLQPGLLTGSLSPATPGSVSISDKALRKCRGGGRVLYTDGECPQGTRAEQLADDRLSVLPALRPGAAEPAASAPPGAQTPLRRLAGPDESAAQRERMIEQALHR